MRRPIAIALVLLSAIPLVVAVAGLPAHGDPSAPVHTHVSAHYIERGAEEAGATNLVTGVLLNYRGLDAAGEVTVIFTALIAVLAILLGTGTTPESTASSRGASDRRGADRESTVAPVSPIVSFVVRLLAPFIALYAAYVILHGHVTPGGGFQGGAILAGLFIALAMVLGTRAMQPVARTALAPWLQGAAVLSFVVVGTVGAFLTGFFLGFPAEPPLHLVRELLIIALEVGIAIGGAAVLATIFLHMEAS